MPSLGHTDILTYKSYTSLVANEVSSIAFVACTPSLQKALGPNALVFYGPYFLRAY